MSDAVPPPPPRPLDRARAMPWLLKYEALRLLALPIIRLRFALHGVQWGSGWRVFGMPIIQKHRGSQIVVGEGVVMRSWRGSNPLVPRQPVVLSTRSADAVIQIGNGTGLTGTVIVAEERVDIGRDVFIGANATLVDTDFHPLRADRRRLAPSDGRHRPIVVEDEVFIGMGAIILKGVRVGARSVVGAGSVVAADVPPDTVVAGNPARVVRHL